MKTLLFLSAALFAASPLAAQQQTLVNSEGFKLVGGVGVASVAVGTAGTGYTSLPTVAFTDGGGGTQASGTATLKVVGSVTVTAAGTGYTVGDVLTVVGGTKTTAATLTVATITGGGGTGPVGSYTIANAGVYTVPVTTTGAATTGGTGTGATVTVGYGVGTVVLTAYGNSYTSAPTIAFTGGAGTGAAATATLAAQAAVNVYFKSILPLSTTVIAAITYPPSLPASKGAYNGDREIIGKTLTAGIRYPIQGNTIKLTSGLVLLERR